jgi:hypothetical protein
VVEYGLGWVGAGESVWVEGVELVWEGVGVTAWTSLR